MTTTAHDYPKPPLTDGNGRTRPQYASDAPRQLKRLGLTQVPGEITGNGYRGAWVRGWCDGVRRRSSERNPYLRGGSGWHNRMATLYLRGWRVGRDVVDVALDVRAMGSDDPERRRELRERVLALLPPVVA